MQSLTQSEATLRPVTVRVEDGLYREMKATAALEGKSLQDWLAEAIDAKLKRFKKGKAI